MRFHKIVVASIGAFVALTTVDMRDASACGGCFPPAEQVSVVTDHRMVLTVSKTQSTLYDQIQYSGNPKEFAWVLPIAGTVDVGLSADSLFSALNSLSAVSVQQPPTNCPARPTCEGEFSNDSASAGSSSSSSSGGVSVLKEEVVGPYETVQLKSDDPQALTNWLTTNGFNIPEDIKPVIAQYVAEKLNFLALRLKPGEGVSSMRPVRVTTQGAGVVLPLRMVAAGTGAQVGITLWVISEGRYEPQNFPSFVIKNEDLVWDWAANQSNYQALRTERSAASGGKAWEIESSQMTARAQIQSVVRSFGYRSGANGAGGDYLPVEDANGGVTKTAETVREEDLATAFAGIASGQEHLTRMRADLSRAALATDLTLVASQDQSEIPNVRLPKGEKGQPLCPVYDGCRQVGVAPRDEAASRAYFNGGGTACDSVPRRTGSFAELGILGGFVTLAVVRAVQRRRKG